MKVGTIKSPAEKAVALSKNHLQTDGAANAFVRSGKKDEFGLGQIGANAFNGVSQVGGWMSNRPAVGLTGPFAGAAAMTAAQHIVRDAENDPSCRLANGFSFDHGGQRYHMAVMGDEIRVAHPNGQVGIFPASTGSLRRWNSNIDVAAVLQSAQMEILRKLEPFPRAMDATRLN